MAEIGKSAIANYEAGRNLPKAPVLKKLALALGRSVNSLLQGEETSTESDQAMRFNPKLERMLEQLMEEGGYDTRKELFASLFREKVSSTATIPAKHDTSGEVTNKGGVIKRKIKKDGRKS